jgi:hypothetical protein
VAAAFSGAQAGRFGDLPGDWAAVQRQGWRFGK